MYIGAQGDGGFEFNPNSHASGDVASIEFSGRENSDIEKGKIKDDAPNAQLYNLESDGAQKKNSYNNHPEIVKEMEAILDLYIPKIDRMVKK